MVDNSFSSIVRTILGSFLPFLLLFSVLGFLAWRRTLPKERSPFHSRVTRAAFLVGALVIGMLVARSERLRGVIGVETAQPTITRILAGDDSRPFDRLQVLAAIRVDETSAQLAAVMERVIPIAAEGNAVANFPELSMWVEIAGLLQGSPRQFSQSIRCESGLHRRFQMMNGFQEPSCDLGDARPFYTDGLTYEPAAPLRLRDLPKGCVSLFWRGLRPDDRIEQIPTSEFESALQTRFVSYQLNRMNFEALGSTRSAFDRIRSEANGTAITLLLLAGLILFAPLGLRFALPLTILTVFAMLGVDARRDRDLLLERLEAPDPTTRATAAAILGQSGAFAVTACSALRNRFEIETDPAVRAEIVRAVADSRRFVGALSEARELFQSARKDESPEVKQAIDSVGGLRR